MARRHVWAVEQMAVRPGDRVLEIGCGSGLATAEVCALLRSGRITAIDRSVTMTQRAERRVARHLAAGRAEVRCEEFDADRFKPASFDKVFAVNLSLFWLGDTAGAVREITRLLAPEGELFVFCERPVPATDAIAGRVAEAMREGGMAATVATAPGKRGHTLLCVCGVSQEGAAAQG